MRTFFIDGSKNLHLFLTINLENIMIYSKNHPENHYLKIAILYVASMLPSAAASLNDLKIQLSIKKSIFTIAFHINILAYFQCSMQWYCNLLLSLNNINGWIVQANTWLQFKMSGLANIISYTFLVASLKVFVYLIDS